MSSHRRTRAALLALLLLIAVLALTTTTAATATAAAESPSTPQQQRPRRARRPSFRDRMHLPPGAPDPRVAHNPLFQCREDLNRLCMEPTRPGDATPVRVPTPDEMWKCISVQVSNIRHAACRSYIEAMLHCERDAKQFDGCMAPATTRAVSLRRCLRDVKPELLSKECRETEFFESIQQPKY